MGTGAWTAMVKTCPPAKCDDVGTGNFSAVVQDGDEVGLQIDSFPALAPGRRHEESRPPQVRCRHAIRPCEVVHNETSRRDHPHPHGAQGDDNAKHPALLGRHHLVLA